ncbi:undecaprenyl pyrophosphate synthetase [Sporocytophaga myxococcoides]|uniref:Isoprenyl transferase n=1 Tax=Sporocytophaga myxococcoides TaxID=153721 RepID=A0A098LKT3_9BACT|nr:isoprenyl transferase [Sporocytophaga myxococcoides]GAL87601.1 undecaprenyl pyrophosphate synthetase [Sporocytophaga myxococcoides]
MNLIEQIDKTKIPAHIAIIMDGNGRWAKKKGAISRIFGHKSAITSVREATEACAKIGVKYLTLYAFSTENWNRPKEEVDALMQLLVSTVKGEVKQLNQNNVRLSTIGNFKDLPSSCQKELSDAINATKSNTGLTLTLALSYSGRWDILEATRRLLEKVEKNELKSKDLTLDMISDYVSTAGIPDPELVIRTSGEFRVSNFLLWQIAYSEFYITDILWPDFREGDLYNAVLSFQKRERRFGMISEQLKQV